MRIPGTGLEIRRQGLVRRKAAVSATTFDVAASRSVGWFPIFSNSTKRYAAPSSAI
jgi:hypothetical protein